MSNMVHKTNYLVIRDGDGKWFIKRNRPNSDKLDRLRRKGNDDEWLRLMLDRQD